MAIETPIVGTSTDSRERSHRSAAENDNDARLLAIRRDPLHRSAPDWPGETRALDEAIGLAGLRLRRHPQQSYCAYAIYEG